MKNSSHTEETTDDSVNGGGMRLLQGRGEQMHDARKEFITQKKNS
jgi:hypothetical protein